MKDFKWVDISCSVMVAITIFGAIFLMLFNSNPPQKEYAFLKAEVMYGKLPPNTARVSKCFAEFVGYRAVWNGRIYYITGTTGHNPFHSEHIYFSGNENIKIYDKRLIPVFISGSIEDKIIGGER